MRVRHRLSRTKSLPVQWKRRRSHDIGINSKRNGLRSWRVELVTQTSAFIHYVILFHKLYIELPILYQYFGIFYCESEIKCYSKIMSQGQKRPQNSSGSDCRICNLDFKNFRGRTPGPPFRCRLASLGGRYRPPLPSPATVPATSTSFLIFREVDLPLYAFSYLAPLETLQMSKNNNYFSNKPQTELCIRIKKLMLIIRIGPRSWI